MTNLLGLAQGTNMTLRRTLLMCHALEHIDELAEMMGVPVLEQGRVNNIIRRALHLRKQRREGLPGRKVSGTLIIMCLLLMLLLPGTWGDLMVHRAIHHH